MKAGRKIGYREQAIFVACVIYSSVDTIAGMAKVLGASRNTLRGEIRINES